MDQDKPHGNGHFGQQRVVILTKIYEKNKQHYPLLKLNYIQDSYKKYNKLMDRKLPNQPKPGLISDSVY